MLGRHRLTRMGTERLRQCASGRNGLAHRKSLIDMTFPGGAPMRQGKWEKPGDVIGASGATGGAELRAVPARPGATGVSGATGGADRAAGGGLGFPPGGGVAGGGGEAPADEGGAAGADTAGGSVRGPARERAGLRSSGIGKDAFTV